MVCNMPASIGLQCGPAPFRRHDIKILVCHDSDNSLLLPWQNKFDSAGSYESDCSLLEPLVPSRSIALGGLCAER